MSTRPSTPRLRRSRPLLALTAGLLLALAGSGSTGLAVPAEGLGDLGTPRAARPCGEAAAATDAVTTDAGEPLTLPVAAPPRLFRRATAASALSASDDAGLPDAEASTGIDLEVRIGRIHIGFPWLKALPISPGRHVLLELMPARGADAR